MKIFLNVLDEYQVLSGLGEALLENSRSENGSGAKTFLIGTP
jgi:hypothetical protein